MHCFVELAFKIAVAFIHYPYFIPDRHRHFSFLQLFPFHAAGPSMSCYHPLQSPGHISVPQTINNRIQQGGEDSVKGWEDFVFEWGVVGLWKHVGVQSSPIKQRHHYHMWWASGESLLPPFFWLYLMYGDKYLCIGRDHHGEGDQQHHNTADVHHHLIHGLVTTGQPQHRGSLAEEVVDLVGGTERETHGDGGEEKTVQSATEPRAG